MKPSSACAQQCFQHNINNNNNNNNDSPVELPPLVSEVSANFCGERVSRGQCDGYLRPYSRFSTSKPL
jgi:hypothetical protein